MDSLAVVSLVVCGTVGAATLAVGWRWLRRLASAPSPQAVPGAIVAETPHLQPTLPLPLLEDESTQPMMRTSWGISEWPNTTATDFGAGRFEPTQPSPLRPE